MATIYMTPGNDYSATELDSERADIQAELEQEWEAEQAQLARENAEILGEAPFDVATSPGPLRTIIGTPMKF